MDIDSDLNFVLSSGKEPIVIESNMTVYKEMS